MEIFGMFGELSINYKLTGEAVSCFFRENMASIPFVLDFRVLKFSWTGCSLKIMNKMYISWEECINLREVKVSYLMNDCINLLEESDVQNWCFQVFSCMPQRGYFHRDLKSGTRVMCILIPLPSLLAVIVESCLYLFLLCRKYVL